jgi:hypothetical protein
MSSPLLNPARAKPRVSSQAARSLAFMRVDRQGRVHDEHGRFSAVVWRATDRAGRRITLTRAALRHARGEDERRARERRAYLTARIIRTAVERGRRHADVAPGRERLIAHGVGPSAHLVVVVEIHAGAGTVITAYAMRRVPSAWRRI